MARSLRIDLVNGWYHVTARGNERKAIFLDDTDRRRFLELIEETTQRFGWRLHAYVLMRNHYHLLVQTPQANLSAGMQWLGVSYTIGFNRRRGRVGHLFQGRFHASVLEEGAAPEVSRYLHLNPVRVKRLGLSKLEQRRQAVGMSGVPQATVVRERIRQLREFRWSSYRGYVGLQKPPDWLSTRPVLSMLGGPARERSQQYREYVELAVREGLPESPWDRLEAGVLLGSQEFVRRVKRFLKGNQREQPSARKLQPRCRWEQVVHVIETLKEEPWGRFRDRHGDWGRDAVLWLARRHCGMKLQDLGDAAGGIDYVTVSTAIQRLERRARQDRQLTALLAKADRQLQNAKM
ncbi:MAG: transposase [Verrucomicrobiia bacterium]|jgi:REP element-mobilizing transposase RayT